MQHSISVQHTKTDSQRHDSVTIALHWLSAVLVGILWGIGQTVDVFPSGPLRVDYRSVHIVLGSVLGIILVGRLGWRLTRRPTLAPLGHGLLLFAARLTHGALYALLFVAMGLGVANVWVRGDAVFNMFAVPAYDPGNGSLVHLIGGWHALAANAVLITAGIHAAAALFHHFVLRDTLLRRMSPW